MQQSDVFKQILALLKDVASSNTQTRKQAEENMKRAQAQQGYAIVLLQIMSDKSIDDSTRTLSAIIFKNFIKTQWQPNVSQSVIKDSDKAQIKSFIVNLMLSTSGSIQKILAEVITNISEYDFPENWSTLLSDIVSKFEQQDLNVIHGVLFTAHSIFKRYRHAFLSDELLKEMLQVLKEFANPMLKLFKGLCSMIQPARDNRVAIQQLFKCIVLLLKIFYSLNWQDLPEHFEDNIKEYMSIFQVLLQYSNPLLMKDDTNAEKPGLLLVAQALVCQNINLYMEKHEEEFEPFVDGFAKLVWDLLMKSSMNVEYDSLVAKAIQFMTTISKSVKHVLFKEETALKQICENIVIPNLTLRKTDEEQFEDNPEEYIRRDIEGSDSDTRRRSAVELLKALTFHYETVVTNIIMAKIPALLQHYAAQPKTNWNSKDIAIYLISAIAVKAATAKKGIVEVNKNVNILEFCTSQVLTELTGASPAKNSLLQADAIKFIASFRNQIPKELMLNIFPLLIKFLSDDSRVVHTYASWAIEKILTVKDDKTPRFTKELIRPIAQALLSALFKLLTNPESEDNEYVMKTIMRLSAVLKEEMSPFMQIYVQSLSNILAQKAKNPKNPMFNHYMFESFATVIKFNTQSAPAFESALFPLFQQILQQDVQEFTPYVFQLMSQLLDIRPAPLPQGYIQMFPGMLSTGIWENTGNIPGLVNFISAFTKKAPEEVMKGHNLEAVLGIFQKLVSSKTLDHEGFYILNAIVENIPSTHLKPLFPKILSVLFTRLQKKKTGKFVRCLVVFFSSVVVKHGPSLLIDSIEALQPNLFGQIAPIWLEGLPKVQGKNERKLCAAAVTKLLCETTVLLERFTAQWGKFLVDIVKFLSIDESKTSIATTQDAIDAYTDEADTDAQAGYKVEYTKLTFASKSQEDKTQGIPDPKVYLALSLNTLLSRPNFAQKLVPSIKGLGPDVTKALISYYAQANLNGQIFA